MPAMSKLFFYLFERRTETELNSRRADFSDLDFRQDIDYQRLSDSENSCTTECAMALMGGKMWFTLLPIPTCFAGATRQAAGMKPPRALKTFARHEQARSGRDTADVGFQGIERGNAARPHGGTL